MLEAARQNGVKRYLYTSSGCVYPEYKQVDANVVPVCEDDAYPAQPQDAYVWEELMTERLCTHYREEYGLVTRIVRFHNIVFDPLGGREKGTSGNVSQGSYGQADRQPRNRDLGPRRTDAQFLLHDDCTKVIYRLMRSDFTAPLNLGQDRVITINQLADMVGIIAGVEIEIAHVAGPRGVRGRNSKNTRLRQVLAWAPEISLEIGLTTTYAWIEDQVRQRLATADGLNRQPLEASA